MAPIPIRNRAIIRAAPGPDTAADVLAARMSIEFAGDLGIHSDCSAGVLDGQWAGTQSPSGSVVWPTSIK